MKSAVEHLSSILDKFAFGDLDGYSYDGLASAINELENFFNSNANNPDLHTVVGLVSSIISHFYMARGYAATPDIPRNIEYYQNMNSARKLIQEIKYLG